VTILREKKFDMSDPAVKLDPYDDIDRQVSSHGYARKPVKSAFFETGVSVSEALERAQELKIPKSRFSGEVQLQARKPVTIRIFKGEESWFAENENLNIFAMGPDSVQAINDFESHLVYFYLYYRELNPDRATSRAKNLKKIFEENFVEVA
jgi:hypothetical protein